MGLEIFAINAPIKWKIGIEVMPDLQFRWAELGFHLPLVPIQGLSDRGLAGLVHQ